MRVGWKTLCEHMAVWNDERKEICVKNSRKRECQWEERTLDEPTRKGTKDG